MNRAKRPLLLFFTSARSGPGRRMESLLANLARKERERLRVSRVDIDEHPDLAERLDVTDVPTLVLLSEHKPVARLEGRASAPRIERMIGRHLEPQNGRNPAAVSSRTIG
ncbi:MAG TPA: thioredoxin family protein [Gaiellaceae bacterium]|jgi:thioredoxin|nr:thioredoxin family protein [Gaiellaceae bacterium]